VPRFNHHHQHGKQDAKTASHQPRPDVSGDGRGRQTRFRIGNAVGKTGMPIKPNGGENQDQQIRHRQVFNESQPGARTGRRMREYEDIDRQEERNRPHHDLYPKTNPTQTGKRPGKAIESRRLEIFHEFFKHNHSYLFQQF
jgi:hypothetical protein